MDLIASLRELLSKGNFPKQELEKVVDQMHKFLSNLRVLKTAEEKRQALIHLRQMKDLIAALKEEIKEKTGMSFEELLIMYKKREDQDFNI